MKKNKGITLVALIVTIVLLIIIAGVAINVALGENGIFTKSKQAADTYRNAAANEIAELGKAYNIIAELTGEDSEGSETIVYPTVVDENPGVLEVGSGDESDTYYINCVEDLVGFAHDVNSSANLYSGKVVKLNCNLDIQNSNSYSNPNTKYISDSYGYTSNASGTAIKDILTDTTGLGFVPIGIAGGNALFAGTFDGNNKVINNLYIKASSYGGLFGAVSQSITIENLKLLSINSFGNAPTGGLIGQVSGRSNIKY